MKEKPLSGEQISITGRFASMNRASAVEHLREAGGEYVEKPGRRTTVLVVGQADWPLKRDGRPTQNLQKARKLQQNDIPIQIITEIEFLQALGLSKQIEELHRLYTTAQLRRILGVSESQIRYWVRIGLLKPTRITRRLAWFDFQEVMRARALNSLTSSGVSTSRVKNSLEKMTSWLPEAKRMLVLLENYETDGQLRVRLPDGSTALPDGQLLLSFAETPGEPHAVQPFVRQDTGEYFQLTDSTAVDRWFAAGVIAEENGNFREAEEDFERALLAGGPQAETCFNLGNVLYEQDRKAEAVQRFLQAVELDPEYIEAWNNLGSALADLDKPKEALRALRTALHFEPQYADAHWNMAQTYEYLGETDEARLHWLAYLEQDPNSSSAEEARQHLAELRDRD